MRPGHWKLSTRTGRTVEAISFRLIALSMVFVICACTTFFLYATPKGHGIGPQSGATALECFYFSIVTFSSLGYGDLHPEGFGRLVAVIEVMSGLILVALFVGKVASERQSGIIRLLYTSDNQRRLSAFVENIESVEAEIHCAHEDYDHDQLAALGQRLNRLFGGLRQYLRFQSHEGALLEFGNKGPLRTLYASIVSAVEAASYASKTRMLKERSKASLDKAIQRAADIARDMIELTSDKGARSQLRQIQSLTSEYEKYKTRAKQSPVAVSPVDVTEVTEALLCRVRPLLSKDEEWPKNIQKQVAQTLHIPNKHAQRCIDELISRGEYETGDERS